MHEIVYAENIVSDYEFCTVKLSYIPSTVSIRYVSDFPTFRRPSIDYGTTTSATKYGVGNVSIQLQVDLHFTHLWLIFCILNSTPLRPYLTYQKCYI